MNKIIDRIQKLLKLAANAGNEHEAALAAERASQLMAEHEIHEAQLSLDGSSDPRTPEPIDHSYQVTSTGKRVAWHMRVTLAVAKSYSAQAYWRGGKVMLFGRLSAVQAATYTSQYLMREIERVTDLEAPARSKDHVYGGYSRSFRNAFRLGCASRIAARLEGTQTLRDNINDAPLASAGVIAIIKNNHAEVEEAYESYSKEWKSRGSIGNVTSRGGYESGLDAGSRVALGGGRAGLPRGQGTFKP